MKSRTTQRFRDRLAALPEPVQRQAQEAYRLFQTDPSHPSRRFKPISPSDPALHSVRVGLRYRAIGIRDADAELWIWVGSHADYNREIRRH